MMTSGSLFGPASSEDIRQRLNVLFDAWLRVRNAAPASAPKGSGALREESAGVYRDMWTVFATWCANRDRDLARLDQADLIAFLDSLGRHGDATARYINRMCLLIDWLDRFDGKQTGRAVNTAIAQVRRHSAYRLVDNRDDEPLPEFLTAAQARALIDHITGGQLSPAALHGWTWQALRDRTAVAVQLGGGITPGEVRGLTLEQVIIEGGRVKDEPWALALPANGNFAARQTPLSGWAGRLLARWLGVRADMPIPGAVLLPSTRTGREWSKAGCINGCREVLAQAGIPNPAGGTFRLRHTFALRQLTRHDESDVARWLGVSDPSVMERYRRVLFRPVDVV